MKSLSFIESQVGSMHQMTEFEEERSNLDVMRAVKAISKSMEGAKNGDKGAAKRNENQSQHFLKPN